MFSIDAILQLPAGHTYLFYKKLESTPKTKKNYYIARKPWWNDELGALAKEIRSLERDFLGVVRSGKRANSEKSRFLSRQRDFDRMVKKEKRRWQRQRIFELEQANQSDPKEFWNFIKNLRKSKKSSIPNEVYTDDTHTDITDDPFDVLNRWAMDFGSLLTPPEYTDAEKEWIDEIGATNRVKEHLMQFNVQNKYNSLFSIA